MSHGVHEEVVGEWCALPRELHEHFQRLIPSWDRDMTLWRCELRRIESSLLGQRTEAAVSRVQSRDASVCSGDVRTADGAHALAAGRAAPGSRYMCICVYIGDNAVTPPRSAVQADLFGECFV